MQYIHHYKSPLGGIILTSDGRALTGLYFEDSQSGKPRADSDKSNSEMPEDAPIEKDLPVFAQTDRWLDIYFSGHEPGFTPPIHMKTTPFRKAVWEILLTIPFGRTMTYGEIAARIAERNGLSRMSAQAVGGAVGHNAISLIIPCHRVVGADGSLTGYAGGIDRKVKLLSLEKADMSSLYIPPKGTAL